MMLQMQQKMQAAFTQSDTDGDGKLSKTEFAAFDALMKAGAPQGAQAASGAAQGAPSADDIFSAMDTDGDGSVTLSEAEAFKPPHMHHHTMSALLQTQEADSSSDTSDGTSSTGDLMQQLISSLTQQLVGQYSQQATGNTTSSLLAMGADISA